MLPVQTPVVSKIVQADKALYINLCGMQRRMDGVKQDTELITLVLLLNPEL